MARDNARFAFFHSLMVLSLHYDESRFGKLVRFVLSLATDVNPQALDDVPDESVICAVRNHLGLWFGDQGSKINTSGMTIVRGELIDHLSEYGTRFPNWPTGKLMNRLATLARKNLDDIDDCDFLAAARQHFVNK